PPSMRVEHPRQLYAGLFLLGRSKNLSVSRPSLLHLLRNRLMSLRTFLFRPLEKSVQPVRPSRRIRREHFPLSGLAPAGPTSPRRRRYQHVSTPPRLASSGKNDSPNPSQSNAPPGPGAASGSW